ncbi:prenyltransferase [Bombiscardovia apis]|uniref:Prenyltransferase n=1 Tax=Bombiscardovia apis TaxID=2932182 RepID=A0ABN6SGE0_9BIFI|nr:prenyltransferase [Bombiscardovia apis]BDR55046.1 prenyltransferase [Bombiscardovia apis]
MNRRWLDWPTFVELTEIFTAPLNIAWFAMGASIAHYLYGVVNWANMLLCFVAIIFFDLAVNITDNYYDYVHARDREGYAKHTNVIGKRNLPLRGVWWLGLSLYLISLVPGFILVARTGWPLVILGIIGYAAGIFYTAGRFPINATPLCETVVALTITYMVQLVCVYICVYGHYPFDWALVGKTLMVCLPVTLIFFTVQLANNVADRDEDIANGRHTLAYFLGSKRSLVLMRIMQALGALWPLLNWATGLVPWPAALSVLILPFMWRGMQPFYAKPDKQTTYFPLIKAASLFFVGYTLLLVAGVWL